MNSYRTSCGQKNIRWGVAVPSKMDIPAVVDPKQLKRIENVHRGFFYQHLYAVGCMLLAAKGGVEYISVERDEDIEVISAKSHIYIQIKTRKESLIESDIRGSLELFEEIKEKHSRGDRSLSPFLVIVSNVEPGGGLRKKMKEGSWSDDVNIVTPGGASYFDFLPPAWKDIQTGMDWCVRLADEIEYTTLTPQNIVFKLAAWVQFLCTGEQDENHIIDLEAIKSLFEQIVTQLQGMPEPPEEYYGLEGDLCFPSDALVRLVTGLSGAGKTAWVAHESIRIGVPVVYFDVAGVEKENILPSFVREVAAALAGKSSKSLGEILLPGSSAVDSLRALNFYLKTQAVHPYLVVDNSHRVPSESLRVMVGACPEARWLLLSHPGALSSQIEISLDVKAKELGGWSVETIGAILSSKGVNFRIKDCDRLKTATGGLPLYVLSSISLVQKEYKGQLIEFLNDFERSDNWEQSAQERILSDSFDRLGIDSKSVCGILKICEGVPLNKDELSTAYDLAFPDAGKIGKAIRSAIDGGVVQRLEGATYKLHDAFGVIAQSWLDLNDDDELQTLKRTIIKVLSSSTDFVFSIDRILLQLQLLNAVGEYERLIDVCTSMAEPFQEMGISSHIESLLHNIVKTNSDVTSRDLFWVYDTFAFFDLQNGAISSAKKWLNKMKPRVDEFDVGSREHTNYFMKEMLVASRERNISKAKKVYKSKLSIIEDPFLSRFIKYNYAVVLYDNKQYSEASDQAFSLVLEYLRMLGLSFDDIDAKNPPEILKKITTEYDPDDFKRLADCYDLHARSVLESGGYYGLAKLHAFKFYNMAHAFTSAMTVGQDIVDDFISPLGAVDAARQFIEQTLLPSAKSYKMMDWIIPIRSQYAVVLAYCGASLEAAKQLEIVEPFRNAVDSRFQKELENHARMTVAIIRGYLKPPPRMASEGRGLYHSAGAKVGRNSPCPCGSGKKYKKCCGA